jgi:hypothetical protein
VAKLKELSRTKVWEPYWADVQAKKGVDAATVFKRYQDLYNKYLAKYG